MLILGVLLLLLGVLMVVGAVFLTDGTDLEYAGRAVEPLTLYFSGVLTLLVLVLGLILVRGGTRRGMRARREHKELEQLKTRRGRAEGGTAESSTVEGPSGAQHPHHDGDGDPRT